MTLRAGEKPEPAGDEKSDAFRFSCAELDRALCDPETDPLLAEIARQAKAFLMSRAEAACGRRKEEKGARP